MRRATLLDLVVGFFLFMFFLLPMALLVLVHPAFGHKAPSGWEYPGDCCAGQDCRPISCSTIIDQPDGSVLWTGIRFGKEQVRMSGDHTCHVCISYNGYPIESRSGHCIYLSPSW